jgi:hypothetical protein
LIPGDLPSAAIRVPGSKIESLLARGEGEGFLQLDRYRNPFQDVADRIVAVQGRSATRGVDQEVDPPVTSFGDAIDDALTREREVGTLLFARSLCRIRRVLGTGVEVDLDPAVIPFLLDFTLINGDFQEKMAARRESLDSVGVLPSRPEAAFPVSCHDD